MKTQGARIDDGGLTLRTRRPDGSETNDEIRSSQNKLRRDAAPVKFRSAPPGSTDMAPAARSVPPMRDNQKLTSLPSSAKEKRQRYGGTCLWNAPFGQVDKAGLQLAGEASALPSVECPLSLRAMRPCHERLGDRRCKAVPWRGLAWPKGAQSTIEISSPARMGCPKRPKRAFKGILGGCRGRIAVRPGSGAAGRTRTDTP